MGKRIDMMKVLMLGCVLLIATLCQGREQYHLVETVDTNEATITNDDGEPVPVNKMSKREKRLLLRKLIKMLEDANMAGDYAGYPTGELLVSLVRFCNTDNKPGLSWSEVSTCKRNHGALAAAHNFILPNHQDFIEADKDGNGSVSLAEWKQWL